MRGPSARMRYSFQSPSLIAAVAAFMSIDSPDDFVAARLVVELAIPALAVIHLIAAHFRLTRHAEAADLHAAVDEARAVEAQFQAQIEIGIGLLRREEFIARHRSVSEPPRISPSSTRQIFGSPSHPSSVLPSKRGTGAVRADVVTRANRKTMRRFMEGKQRSRYNPDGVRMLDQASNSPTRTRSAGTLAHTIVASPENVSCSRYSPPSGRR